MTIHVILALASEYDDDNAALSAYAHETDCAGVIRFARVAKDVFLFPISEYLRPVKVQKSDLIAAMTALKKEGAALSFTVYFDGSSLEVMGDSASVDILPE